MSRDPATAKQELKLYEIRASRLKFAPVPELVAAPPTPGSLGARVSRQAPYKAEFGTALKGVGDLTVPWPPGAGSFNNFWYYYFETRPPDELSGSRAWELFVPLRLSIPVRSAQTGTESAPSLQVTADGLPGKLRLEAYAYPHGVALLSTVYLAGDYTPKQAVDAIIETERAIVLRLIHESKIEKNPYRLPLVEDRILRILTLEMTGGTESAAHKPEPFLITTVVRGEGAALDEPVANQSERHCLLHALCKREDGDPPALDDLRLEGPTGANLLYAPPCARAVWIPSAQRSTEVRQTRLGCYHRNLVQLSLQVESLLAVAEMAAASLRMHRSIRDPQLYKMARRAVEILGRLYGKTQSIYHSASAPRQIEENRRSEAVNLVRGYYGWGSLER